MTMSIARRFRKVRLLVAAICLGAALVSFGILIPSTDAAATTERIVIDPASGLAINGIDPVSYFTEAAAKFGKADIEEAHAGVVWRFRNVGNRAAFIAHPEVYMPRFGGYDPVAVAQGKSVPGNPLHWAIKDRRLYLFFDARTRAAFMADIGRIAAEAEQHWPQVEKKLTP